MDIIIAANINNEAIKLEQAGNYQEAEKKFRQSLKIKEKSYFSSPIGVALSQNGLAELLLKMGKLQEAQELLEKAYEVRKDNDDFDKTCTADNLGRLFEMKGDPEKAREWRTANGPNRMICSNFDCPKSQMMLLRFSKINELKKCGKCKCVYYCGKKCQTDDWPRHKMYCKAPGANDAAK